MEHCPTELLHDIFSLACNDGGFTGRSLSMVSRTIRQKSRNFRFYSIACRGTAQTIAFASVLDNTPPQFRVIRHLFISTSFRDKVSTAQRTSNGQTSAGSVPEISFCNSANPLLDMPGTNQGNVAEVLPLNIAVHSAVLCILTAVATTLWKLSLFMDWNSWLLLPLPPDLPNLLELSINHQFAGGSFHNKALSPLSSAPSLRRLVITGYRRIVDSRQVITSITSIFPSLTHLCLPLGHILKNMMPMLESLREKTALCDNQPLNKDAFPSSLKHFILLMTGPYYPLPPNLTVMDDNRVSYVKRSWDRELFINRLSEWEDAWIESINGGDGYWSMTNWFWQVGIVLHKSFPWSLN